MERMVFTKQFAVFLASLFITAPALAQFPLAQTIFENVSGSEISATSVTIFASRVGRGSGGVDYGYCTGVSGPCDTCKDGVGNALRKCNQYAIDIDSSLVIRFPSSVAGVARLMQENGTSKLGNSTETIVGVGGYAEVKVAWSEVCSYVTGESTCGTTNGSKNIVVGVEPYINGGTSQNLTNSTVKQTVNVRIITNFTCDTTADTTNCAGGIYKFDIRAGDEKAYLRNLTSGNASFPVISGHDATIAKLRAYYIPATNPTLASSDPCATDIASLRNGSKYFETEITKPGDAIELGGDAIRGLSNLQKYVFKLALVDKASNVFYFTEDTQCGDLRKNSAETAPGKLYGNHVVIPDQVTGLLGDANNCFIATAAYGSSLDPHVQTFRNFRDRFLMTSAMGEKLVRFYYRHSPELADIIRENSFLRGVARAFLWPLWALSSLMIQLGFMVTTLILASTALLAWAIIFSFRSTDIFQNLRISRQARRTQLGISRGEQRNSNQQTAEGQKPR